MSADAMDGQSKQSTDILTPALPLEMIGEEILARLAVKPLLKFRCVSKSWRSLIDSEPFIKTNHKKSMKNQSFPHQRAILQRPYSDWPNQCPPLLPLLNGTELAPFPLEVPTNNTLGKFRVVGCCNGLLCMLEIPTSFIMWNPSTRVAKKLPEASRSRYAGNCGFGWVESSGEYKVFGCFRDLDSNETVDKLYSSRTRSWKTLGTTSDHYRQVGVFVGEKLHYWINEGIVFLDLKSEVFGRIGKPNAARWNRLNMLFGALGGCLSVLLHNYEGGGVVDEVWVVKEYGVKECWERVVARDRVIELLQQTPSIVGPNGEILVLFRFAFLVYYPQDNVFRLLPKYQDYELHHLYVESLESP